MGALQIPDDDDDHGDGDDGSISGMLTANNLSLFFRLA